jgi:Zn-finger in Ran binding protein and others
VTFQSIPLRGWSCRSCEDANECREAPKKLRLQSCDCIACRAYFTVRTQLRSQKRRDKDKHLAFLIRLRINDNLIPKHHRLLLKGTAPQMAVVLLPSLVVVATRMSYNDDDDDDHAFSEALAHGIPLSEHEWIQQQERDERESKHVARRFNQEELHAADHEYAKAVESSEQQYTVDTTTHQLNQVLNEQSLHSSSEVQRGSWDCPKCTFQNDPYAKQCQMCDAPPPPQILTYEPLSPLRFGLELELIIPNGKRDGFTYQYLEHAWNSARRHIPNDLTPHLFRDFVSFTHSHDY